MRKEIENTIRTDAATDATFRAALIANAGPAITERYGVAIPEGVTVRVLDEQANEVILVLPAQQSMVLREADLESVAGGTTYTETVAPCSE